MSIQELFNKFQQTGICHRPPGKKRTARCEHCKKTFITYFTQKTFCSQGCNAQYRREKANARTCAGCQRQFQPAHDKSTQKFCSQTCGFNNRKKPERPRCPQCQKEVSPKQKFCSRTCVSLSQRSEENGSCLTCEKTFNVSRSKRIRGKGIYCDFTCAQTGKVEQLQVNKVMREQKKKDQELKAYLKACERAQQRQKKMEEKLKGKPTVKDLRDLL